MRSVSCVFRQGLALIRGTASRGTPERRARAARFPSEAESGPLTLEYELIRALDQPFRSLMSPRSTRLRLPAQVTVRCNRTRGQEEIGVRM